MKEIKYIPIGNNIEYIAKDGKRFKDYGEFLDYCFKLNNPFSVWVN